MISKYRDSLRIILAIATKDILDALKNRAIFSQIITILFTIVLLRFLPAIESGDIPPRIAVYDAGNSALIAQLEDWPQFDLILTSSQDDMERYLGDKDIIVLGVVLPNNFDERLAMGSFISLDGYLVHWANASERAEVKAFFETQFGEITGQRITINIDDHTVYTRPDSRGYAFLVAISFVLGVTLGGLFIVPLLMIEERQSKTMEALLISPANALQVVLGKAISGAFYCLSAGLLVLILSKALVTNWAVAILALIFGSAFSVALGLLLGSIFKMRHQLRLWGLPIAFPLIVPAFLSMLTQLIPQSIINFMGWTPTVALATVVRASFSNQILITHVGRELMIILAFTWMFVMLTVWIIRRADR
jgi:ABC-2 type transport system permease protein